ncbi:Peroxidase 4 [Nymphaea thermarum]|nr:Peroxidase 4 [Nymphaea thermarum]
MASCSAFVVVAVTILGLFIQGSSHPQLSPDFYSDTCPDLLPIIQHQVQLSVAEERRMGASLLRLFFHDCFVNRSGWHSKRVWNRGMLRILLRNYKLRNNMLIRLVMQEEENEQKSTESSYNGYHSFITQ